MANKSSSNSRIKLLYITNIPAPYRNNRFNIMQEIFSTQNIDFEVEYMSWSEPNRHWELNLEDFKYNYNVYKGIHPTIGNMFAHFNPGFLFRLLRKNYDIAIVGGMGCPTHWLSPFFISSKILKILSVESNLDSTVHKSGLGFKLKKLLTKQYDAFQITGDRSKQYLESINPSVSEKPFITLPNVIEENIFIDKIDDLRIKRNDLRSKFNVKEAEQMWICPARLNQVKGLHLLLPLLEGLENYKLFIVGDGEMKEELQNIINEKKLNVSLEGYKQQDELIEYYAAADLFVLPSLSDPSPLSPIEATAAKLPLLVSSRIGNYDDVLNNNGWGIDIKGSAKDNISLLKSISFKSNKELSYLGEVSRNRFYEVFETKKCVDNFASKLKEVYNSFIIQK